MKIKKLSALLIAVLVIVGAMGLVACSASPAAAQSGALLTNKAETGGEVVISAVCGGANCQTEACVSEASFGGEVVSNKPQSAQKTEEKNYQSSVDVTKVLEKAMTRLDEMIDDLSTPTNDRYMDGTAFVKLGEYELAARAAMLLDSQTAADNKALFSLSCNGKDQLSLYFEDDVLYLGENHLDGSVDWVKFNQIKQDGFASEFAMGLSEMIATGVGEVNTEYDKVSTIIKSAIPIISSTGLFKLDAPYLYLFISKQLADGAYNFELDVSKLSAFFSTLKSSGILDVEAEVAALDEENATMVNQIFEVIFGCSLHDVCAGKINSFPELTITLEFKKDLISGVYLTYKKPADEDSGTPSIAISAGVKNVKINTDATASFVPKTLKMTNVEEGAFRINASVKVPNLLVSEDDTMDLSITMDVFPDMQLALDETGRLQVDLGSYKAVALAENGGVPIAKADFDSTTNTLRLDLTDLYNYVGYDAANTKYEGIVNLQELIDGALEPKPEATPQNAQMNPMSGVYDIIADCVGGTPFTFGTFMELLAPMKALLIDIETEDALQFVADSSEISLSFKPQNLITYLTREDGIIGSSTLATELLSNAFLSDFDNVDSVVCLVCALCGKYNADFYDIVRVFTGEQYDIAAYFAECEFEASIVNDGGLRVAVDVFHEETALLNVEVSATPIAVSKTSTSSGIDDNFQGADIFDLELSAILGKDLLTVLNGLTGLHIS